MARFSQDMLCTIDRGGRFLQVNEASNLILGYEGRELRGRHFSEFVHPEDLPRTAEIIAEVMGGSTHNNLEIRLVHRDGQVRYSLWGGAWSAEDGAIYAIGRDVTELKISRIKLEESEQRYRALFEHNQDVLFLENSKGVVIDVNHSFCEAFGIPRQEAINTRVPSFLPATMAAQSEEGFQEAMAGRTMRRTLEFSSERGKEKVFDVLKSPLTVNGEIIGVQTIAKDITANVRSYETIKRQASKLSTIFESITDAFLMVKPDWVLTYLNCEAEKLLSLDRETALGKSLLEIFPEETGGEFHAQYLYALETGRAVDFTASLRRLNLWLRVKAFPSTEGLSVYFEDVTEQEKAKLELEKLALVASKTSNGVMITDNEGRIEWVNDGFTKLTGFALQEAVGVKPDFLMRGRNTDENTIGRIYGRLGQPDPYREEILICDRWGGEKWLELDVTPVLDGTGVAVRQIRIQTDITERKKAQKELEKLSLVASNTTNGVIITDRERVIEWVNDGFTKLYGYNLEEAVGKGPSELLHSPRTDKGIFSAQEARLLGGEPISFEVLNLRKGGEEVWVSVEISPVFDHTGELSRYVEVQTDITALKRSEQEQARLAGDLYRQNSDLQQFTYMVSHNLRAPVANALGLAELLAGTGRDSDRFAPTLSFLGQSVRKLDEVLRDMNTVLSIRDRRGNLEREDVDIREVIVQAQSTLKGEMALAGGRVDIGVAEGLRVKASKAYLFSIFYNLLSNAIKYRSGERTLSVQIKCLQSADRGTIIHFSDNGSGFDMKKAKGSAFRLYQRFHTAKEGRGMGLYLVKAHVEAMGGQVKVTSRVGIGTRFLVFFPPN
ncbi:PAS domain-containing sensor histidine kinase [Rufibacter latericius]|uniref:histidine kinase n=1 Tax=Rufibacter latericius TaxID=2487040 RepID=A0A3M9MF11_9BACT|nr:PAS domain S-box protein [Rufibacter latericius]RNI24146.1 PAS domain S-box protein [Rufibacter latericius]